MQETFHVAWKTVREEEIEYPKTWLRKIAKNVTKNRVREREKWKDLLANVDEVPEEALGKSENPVNVELEYEGLIDRQDLHLLKLLAIDIYTYPEAAKALNSTAETCQKRANGRNRNYGSCWKNKIFSKCCPLFRFSRPYYNREVSICLTLITTGTAHIPL